MKEINYIESPCGTGKTVGLIKKVNNCANKYLIAVSTNKNGKALSEGISGSVFINSDTSSDKVYKQVEQAVNSHRVIIITHSGLATLTPVLYKLRDYHLAVDELTGNLIKDYHLTISKEDFSNLKTRLGRDSMESKAGIGTVRHLSLKRPFTKELSTNSKILNNILLSSQDGYPVFGVPDKNGKIKELHSIRVNDNYLKILDSFESITVLSATVKGAFNHIVLEALGYKFTEANWAFDSSHKIYNGLIYVLQDGKNISSKLLDKQTKTGTVREDGRNIIDQTLINESSIWFANKKVIETTNEHLNEFSSEEDDIEVKVVSLEQKGSNEFIGIDNAVCLFSVNPSPIYEYLLELLEKHLKLAKGVLTKGWSVSNYLEPVYQNCLRTSYRVPNASTYNKFFIPDMRSYDYLKKKIPSIPDPIILFPDGFEIVDKRKGNSGRKKKYTPEQADSMDELKLKEYIYSDIADIVGVNVSTVKRHLASA